MCLMRLRHTESISGSFCTRHEQRVLGDFGSRKKKQHVFIWFNSDRAVNAVFRGHGGTLYSGRSIFINACT